MNGKEENTVFYNRSPTNKHKRNDKTKSLFGKHDHNDDFRQQSSMGAKISGWKKDGK